MRHISLGTFRASNLMRQYIKQVLDSGRLSYGPFSREFEGRFAAVHGCQYGVLSNSGTSSLLVALQALKELHGWVDGAGVIVPAITFVATVNVVLQAGLRPVLCDVDKEHYDIDPEYLDRLKVKSYDKAIMPVNIFGQPYFSTPVIDFADKHKLKVLVDSCETVLAKRYHKPVGIYGDISCFSFYIAHHLAMGVGGISITGNPDYARKMRSLVNHGLAYDDLTGDGQYDPSMLGRKFCFDSVGHSFRVTELEAALGLAQLGELPEMITKRQVNAQYLIARLNGENLGEYLQLPKTRPCSEHSWMVFPLVCRQEGVRDKLCHFLNERMIETRRMMPLVSQPVYKGLWNPADYPVAQWIDRNGFYIGCHQGLSVEDLEYVVEAIRDFYKR